MYGCGLSTVYTKLQPLNKSLPLCILAVSTYDEQYTYYTSHDCNVSDPIGRSGKSFKITHSSNAVSYANLQDHADSGAPLQKFAYCYVGKITEGLPSA